MRRAEWEERLQLHSSSIAVPHASMAPQTSIATSSVIDGDFDVDIFTDIRRHQFPNSNAASDAHASCSAGIEIDIDYEFEFEWEHIE